MRRRWLISAAVLVAALAFLPVALTGAGTWLLVEEPLQPSRAIVVFGGQLPFRAMEAASIYKQGRAQEVWLTKGAVEDEEELALARLGIKVTPEYAYSQQVLEALGVPQTAIHVLPERTRDTAEEVLVVARELQAAGGDRVILVTSKSHTRRVKYLWHWLVGSHPAAIVRYASDDPYQPSRWWHNTTDAMTVAREWCALVNALAGFPVKSVR